MVAFENCKLLLALLVTPWLGEDVSEGVLRTVLAVPRPAALVEAALRDILGLGADTTAPLPFAAAFSAEPQDFSAAARGPHSQLTCGAQASLECQTLPHHATSEKAWGGAICDMRALSQLPPALMWASDSAQRGEVRRAAERGQAQGAPAGHALPSGPDSNGADCQGIGMQTEGKGGGGPDTPMQAHASGSGLGTHGSVSRVSLVVHAEPGMRSPHLWWAAASAALWGDLLDQSKSLHEERLGSDPGSQGISHEPPATGSDEVRAAEQYPSDILRVTTSSFATSSAGGDSAGRRAHLSRHDVALLLQRTVLVAMVRC